MGCLIFERVVYGKKGVPLKDREFKIAGVPQSPVGTISEIKNFLESQKQDCAHIVDNVENENLNLFKAGHVELATMKKTVEWLLAKTRETPEGELEVEFIEEKEWKR
ncbi:MAG: hypothetical protein ACE5KD_00450 [Candidatus Bathyarchaeia archaeon]